MKLEFRFCDLDASFPYGSVWPSLDLMRFRILPI